MRSLLQGGLILQLGVLLKIVYETNSTDLIPDSLGQIRVAYSCKNSNLAKNVLGCRVECWERGPPWAASALAHFSDGRAKTGKP